MIIQDCERMSIRLAGATISSSFWIEWASPTNISQGTIQINPLQSCNLTYLGHIFSNGDGQILVKSVSRYTSQSAKVRSEARKPQPCFENLTASFKLRTH